MVKKSIYPGRPLHLRDYRLPAETDGSWAELLRKRKPAGLATYLEDLCNLRHPPDDANDPALCIKLCNNPILWGPAVVGHFARVETPPPNALQNKAA